MLAIYARWYTFLPPQWSTIPPPLTLSASYFRVPTRFSAFSGVSGAGAM